VRRKYWKITISLDTKI